MKLTGQQQQYIDTVQKTFEYTSKTRSSILFGVSNSAKVVKGGLLLGVSNLETTKADMDALILSCVLNFPPEDEVYFSILVRKDIRDFLLRLDEMKNIGKRQADLNASDSPIVKVNNPQDVKANSINIKYGKRNNLVRVYLAHDGCLYFRNKEFWNSLNFELSNVGPGIEIDSIAVSIYPPSASARRSLLAREFVGYLGKLIGQEKVHEISVWQDKASVSKEMKRMPDTIPITEIEAIIEELRGYYPGGEIKRFHAALNFLNHKHFVILKGMSGTGKTQLALKYARAVHGFTSSKRPDSFLFVCPVRPEWTDPTGLTGYYDVLSNRYVVPPFLEAVLVAIAYRESPVFVVLDEMNLARVEYYFSDVLSCIETGHSLQLHSNSVPFEGTNGTSIRAELPVPENLFIIGTINIDETTNPVSDKVLDRASIIDMSSVDIPGFLSNLAMKNPELGESIRTCEKEITKLLNIIGDHDFSFGYRAAEEYVRYYHFAKEYLKSDSRDIIDDLMVQKVLVKLKGTERHRIILTSIQNSFKDYTKTRNMVRQLLSDLDEYGSFQATR